MRCAKSHQRIVDYFPTTVHLDTFYSFCIDPSRVLRPCHSYEFIITVWLSSATKNKTKRGLTWPRVRVILTISKKTWQASIVFSSSHTWSCEREEKKKHTCKCSVLSEFREISQYMPRERKKEKMNSERVWVTYLKFHNIHKREVI